MDFPVVKIASNPRHLGKMKKGCKVRLCGGEFPIALHPNIHKKVTKALLKGKGIHHARTPEEVKENHGRGFFDDIGNAFKSAGNFINDNVIKPVGDAIIPVAKEVGKVVVPVAKDLANKGIDLAEQYAPELGGTALAGLATFTGNPELAPLAYQAGSQIGKAGGKYISGLAHSKVNEFDPYHTSNAVSPSYNPLAPPSRQPLTNNLINTYTGQDLGRLDKANMGSYLANLDLSSLESLVQQKRRQLNAPHFDYSGGRSMSQYADAVPPTGMGLYGGMPRGSGLYGGDIIDDAYHSARNLIGFGLDKNAVLARRHRRRQEKGSIGIQGNLLGAVSPPALQSQPYSSNFQFNNTLPPAFQRYGVNS